MARTNTWVNVGTETKATNIQDVLRESGLDYNVVTRPLTTTFNDKEILVPGRVATVNEKGKIPSKKAGSATITASASNCTPAKIKVIVPSFRSREAALEKWRHVLIDTYFNIYGAFQRRI